MKTILLFMGCVAMSPHVHGQTTSVGNFAGITGARSSYFGSQAGQIAVSSSTDNSFFGHASGMLSSGSENTGVGSKTLTSNTSGGANVAIGFESMKSNTTGTWNTATGYLSLRSNTTGFDNTAVGARGLYNNDEGFENTAIGSFALYLNKNGTANSAVGKDALKSNSFGMGNAAFGAAALKANTGGHFNLAAGTSALISNESGSSNTAVGNRAARLSTRADGNTAVGFEALAEVTNGSFNSALGHRAGPNKPFENTTALGAGAIPTGSNTVRIGNTFVTNIGGQVGWSVFSDGRFKRNIKEDVSGLEFINKLRPVSYDVDKQAINKFLRVADSDTQQSTAKVANVRQTGFIAQEVEAVVKKSGYVFAGVEAPQSDDDHYSIRYADFVVPLVKAVQELTARLNEQETKVEEQKREINDLKTKLGLQTGSIDNSNSSVVLLQNIPNPFSSETEIRMSLPETARFAAVSIYNMEGKELKTMPVSGRGNASIKLSGGELNAGIYMYALIVDGKVVDTKRLILTK